MRPNRLRQKLNAGEPTIGTHILSSWPTLVELIGDAENYDYVEFTAERAGAEFLISVELNHVDDRLRGKLVG